MNRLSVRLFGIGLALGAIGTAAILTVNASAGTKPSHTAARHTRTEAPGQPVIDWNRLLLSIVNTPGAQPANIQPTRNFAILHAAIYDAVNTIDRTHQPYLIAVRAPRDASETAAADAAARTALDGLYPSQQATVDATYATELAGVPDGPAKDQGVRLGNQVATDLLAIRATDGANVTPPPFVPGTAPGDYRPTPPNFPAPVFSTWGQVTPFVLASGNQFRPAPPPALTSDAYAAAINEVQSLGSVTSTTRTADQTEIGKFWSPPIQNFWNQIAQEVALSHSSDLPTTARLFAALNLSFADSAIAFYDAKYTYQLWRPVTAIRLADTDGNANTVADPNWLPLSGNTAADPSYPGAHSTISAAGADILAGFYGDAQQFSLTSPALPGVTRSFAGFSAAAQEAGLSRIYAGQHTRLDHTAGLTLGHDVAGFVLHNALLPARGRGLSASADGGAIATRSYVQTNLVSDIPGLAAHTDPNLKNPWGTSVGPGSPIWVSDNHAGVTTLYDGAGNPQPRVVAIPAPPSAPSGAVGAPTGQAFNTFDPSSPDFVISQNGVSGPAFFIFATEDGTIAGWNPSVDKTHAVIAVDRSTATDGTGDVGANYKGLALVTTPSGKFIYATSFRFGTVDVFDNHFDLVNSFTDPTIPAGFAPFGIHNIGGKLYVTFAKQGPGKNDDAARPGNGFVDVFAPNGDLLQRLVSGGRLDSPWAVTLAPATFGAFGGDILVGNFGNGRINAYDPTSGAFEGELSGPGGGPITIDGLWGLRFAPATPGATPNTLFFTAGLNHEADGLFGTLAPNG